VHRAAHAKHHFLPGFLLGRKTTNIQIKYKNNANMHLVMQNNTNILQTNTKMDFVTKKLKDILFAVSVQCVKAFSNQIAPNATPSFFCIVTISRRFLAASTECSAGSNDHFVVGVGVGIKKRICPMSDLRPPVRQG
jgi:hypothetical protein